MDHSIGWFQEEQEGQAKQVWSNIWQTDYEIQQILQQQQQLQQASNGNSDTKPTETSTTTLNNVNNNNGNTTNNTTFNPTRRKATNDNKASTYNMNKYSMRLIGKHGGCPWRPANFNYSRGILGWVATLTPTSVFSMVLCSTCLKTGFEMSSVYVWRDVRAGERCSADTWKENEITTVRVTMMIRHRLFERILFNFHSWFFPTSSTTCDKSWNVRDTVIQNLLIVDLQKIIYIDEILRNWTSPSNIVWMLS